MDDLMKEATAYRVIYEGNIDEGAVLLGQSIGIANSIECVPDIIDRVINDAEKCLKSAFSSIK